MCCYIHVSMCDKQYKPGRVGGARQQRRFGAHFSDAAHANATDAAADILQREANAAALPRTLPETLTGTLL